MSDESTESAGPFSCDDESSLEEKIMEAISDESSSPHEGEFLVPDLPPRLTQCSLLSDALEDIPEDPFADPQPGTSGTQLKKTSPAKSESSDRGVSDDQLQKIAEMLEASLDPRPGPSGTPKNCSPAKTDPFLNPQPGPSGLQKKKSFSDDSSSSQEGEFLVPAVPPRPPLPSSGDRPLMIPLTSFLSPRKRGTDSEVTPEEPESPRKKGPPLSPSAYPVMSDIEKKIMEVMGGSAGSPTSPALERQVTGDPSDERYPLNLETLAYERSLMKMPADSKDPPPPPYEPITCEALERALQGLSATGQLDKKPPEETEFPYPISFEVDKVEKKRMQVRMQIRQNVGTTPESPDRPACRYEAQEATSPEPPPGFEKRLRAPEPLPEEALSSEELNAREIRKFSDDLETYMKELAEWKEECDDGYFVLKTPETKTSKKKKKKKKSTAAETDVESDVKLVEKQAAPEVSLQNRELAKIEKEKGNKHIKKSRWALALQHLDRAIELDPSNFLYPANRAFCLMNLEDYPPALADLTRSLELEPKHAKAYLRRATTHIKLGNFTQAFDDCKRTLLLEPSNEQAQEEIDRLIKQHPTIEEGSRRERERAAKQARDDAAALEEFQVVGRTYSARNAQTQTEERTTCKDSQVQTDTTRHRDI